MVMRHMDQATRVRMLKHNLLQVRRSVEWAGAGDVVHGLWNAVLVAQGALRLVETRLTQNDADDVDELLALAENRLRACRAAIARKVRPRLGQRLRDLAA